MAKSFYRILLDVIFEKLEQLPSPGCWSLLLRKEKCQRCCWWCRQYFITRIPHAVTFRVPLVCVSVYSCSPCMHKRKSKSQAAIHAKNLNFLFGAISLKGRRRRRGWKKVCFFFFCGYLGNNVKPPTINVRVNWCGAHKHGLNNV